MYKYQEALCKFSLPSFVFLFVCCGIVQVNTANIQYL